MSLRDNNDNQRVHSGLLPCDITVTSCQAWAPESYPKGAGAHDESEFIRGIRFVPVTRLLHELGNTP